MKLHPDKGIDKQLKAVIKAAAENPDGYVAISAELVGDGNRPALRSLLHDLGVVHPDDNWMRLQGYWLARRMHKPAWWLWAKDNWFPTAIALVLALSAIADILLRAFGR